MKFTRIHIAIMVLLAIVIIGGGAFFFFPRNAAAPATNETATSTDLDLSGLENGDVIHGNGYTIERVPVDVLSEMPNPSRPIKFGETIPTEVRTILSARAVELAAAIKKEPLQMWNWFDLAIQYHTANDFEGAKAIWEGLAKLVPQDATAFGNLGRLYEFDLKNFAKAESYFKQALAVSKDQTNYYIELHELYANSYKVGTGADIAIAKEGLKAFPEKTDFYLILGDDYLKVGDKNTARSYYEQALEIAKKGNNANLTITISQKLNQF